MSISNVEYTLCMVTEQNQIESYPVDEFKDLIQQQQKVVVAESDAQQHDQRPHVIVDAESDAQQQQIVLSQEELIGLVATFLKEFVYYKTDNISEAIIDKENDTIQLKIKNSVGTANWKLKVVEDKVKMEIMFGEDQFGEDKDTKFRFNKYAGQTALNNWKNVTIQWMNYKGAELSPEDIAEQKKHRHKVFMGIGPKRQKEMIVTANNEFVQIDNEKYNDVCKQYNNTHTDTQLPSYDLQKTNAFNVPVFKNVKLCGGDNMFGDTAYGYNGVTEEHKVSVAFASGLRLERQKNTHYEDVVQTGTLNKEKYSNTFARHLIPIFSAFKDDMENTHFWLPPFGLGVYAEAVEDTQVHAIAEAWIEGVIKAITFVLDVPEKTVLTNTNRGVVLSTPAERPPVLEYIREHVFLPNWAGFSSFKSSQKCVELWTEKHTFSKYENEIITFVKEHPTNPVIILAGDPVSMPGNEAALGWYRASGDPFALSYLGLLPTLDTGETGIKNAIRDSPYHQVCKQLLEKTQGTAGRYRKSHRRPRRFKKASRHSKHRRSTRLYRRHNNVKRATRRSARHYRHFVRRSKK